MREVQRFISSASNYGRGVRDFSEALTESDGALRISGLPSTSVWRDRRM